MDMEVKPELAIPLCYGCLSADRKLSRIDEEFSEIFYKLQNETEFNKFVQEVQLCWECIAFIKRLKMFQMRMRTAQCLLMQYLQSYYVQDSSNKPQSLSSLSVQSDNKFININAEEKVIHEEHSHLNDTPNHFSKIPIIFNDKQEEFEPNNRLLIDEYPEIKTECNDNVKEEYSSNDHESDYYDTELKLENDSIEKSSSYKQRNKGSDFNEKHQRKKYECYATIVKRKERFKDNFIEYVESVSLNYKEYENVLMKDRKTYSYPQKPYKCKECTVGYMKKIDLLRHNSFCHNKATFPYKCLSCQILISSAAHLEQHWASTHTNMLKCTICSEVFWTKHELKKHLNKRHSKIFICKECSQEFGHLRDFVKHYKSAHDTVICDHCNMNFGKKKSLVAHMKRFHIPAICEICNRTYSNGKTYNYHKRVTHPEQFLGETQQELSYCVECDKQYPSVYKYRRHLQLSPRHTPQKKVRVPCPDCGKVFTRTNFMKNHYKFAHLKVTKNYCDQCDKYYTTGYGLRKHIDRVHLKIPPPKDKICDLCGRGFGTNKILINHRRTHTGERPHKCQYCPAAFAQETAMKTHQKTQHKNIGLEINSS